MKFRSIQPNALANSAPPPKYVRYLRMAAWNAAFIISGLLVVAIVGEVYLRLANPFIHGNIPRLFVDGVGLIREPNAELRFANWYDDNWVVGRTNSLGFLDRDPVGADRAAAGCHIAFIGDSYVEASQVHNVDKFHAQLEGMAARELPRLDITTQAYGIGATGQINQIPFYDEYARRLSPKLVVLVFYLNDFADNSTALKSLDYGVEPDRLPYMSAQKDESGALKLRPPDPEFARFRLPRRSSPWHRRAWHRLVGVSYFAKWLDTKSPAFLNAGGHPLAARAAIIAEFPCCLSLLDGWQPARGYNLLVKFTEEHPPPVIEEALEYTAFGIDQFKRRADRDGAALVIMAATRDMGRRGDLQFDRLRSIAEARGIPVISDYDYIIRHGLDDEDGIWRSDKHWNVLGHRWVAEAVLEWLKANQDVCE